MAKLKFWLIPVIMVGLVLCLAYSPGWAATTYGLRTEQSIQATVSDTVINVPLLFNSTAELQNFTLRVTYDPAYLIAPENAANIAYSVTGSQNFELYVKAYQPAEPGNEIMIAACVRDNGTGSLKTWSVADNQVFLWIPFTPNKNNLAKANTSTKVEIDGFAGDGIQELSLATATITFSEKLCVVKAKLAGAGTLPTVYALRLWGGEAGKNVDYTISTRDSPPDTFGFLNFPPVKPGFTYWLELDCEGYKSNPLEVKTNANQPSVTEVLNVKQINGRTIFVRKITTDKKVQLNFAYRNHLNQIVNWPTGSDPTVNTKLKLQFYTNKNENAPGKEFAYDPQTGGTQLVTSGENLFGDDQNFINYISVTIDPGDYCLSKDDVKDDKGQKTADKYTFSFNISTSTSETPPKKNTDEAKIKKLDVDIPLSTIDTLTMSLGQATTSFAGNESKTAQELKIRSNFDLGLGAGATTQIETTFTASGMSTNYLKVSGTGDAAGTTAQYVDPAKLDEQRFNLAVELKPLETATDITVVSINFTDENGKSFEYDPPEEVRASAGPLEFDVPLHKTIQNEFVPQWTTGNSDSLCEKILNEWMITLKSQDDSSPDYIPPDPPLNHKRYGIYFQRSGNPEIFIPNGSHGESITVIYRNGLFFAEVISKHSSMWSNATRQEAQAMPIIRPAAVVTSSHKKGDHWYECFIRSVRPRFLFQ